MSFHALATGPDIHALTAATYADIAARDADTSFQVAANLDKKVRVESPAHYFMLFSVGPTVWLETSSTGTDEFVDLLDTPSSLTGASGKVIQVSVDETTLEFGQALRTIDSPTFTDLILTGNLTVQGATTTLDTEILLVEDKHIELGVVDIPTDVTANGGGIILKGSGDKTILYSDITESWNFNIDATFHRQMSVGGTSLAANDASIDLKSQDKALLLNRLTVVQRNALDPLSGMIAYITDNDDIEFYDGVSWSTVNGGDVSGPASSVDNRLTRWNGVSGNNIQSSIATLDDLGNLTGLLTLGIGTSAANNASAILEMETSTKGFLMPRMTTAQRDAIVSPAEGLEIFNTDTKEPQFYGGEDWGAQAGAETLEEVLNHGDFTGDSVIRITGTGSLISDVDIDLNINAGLRGALNLTSGDGSGGTGAANLLIKGGGNSAAAGLVTLSGGDGLVNAHGSSVLIKGGEVGPSSSQKIGGHINLTAGQGTGGTNGQGGTITLTSGDEAPIDLISGSGIKGKINLLSGIGTGGFSGADINITSGAGSGNATSGRIYLKTGAASGNSDGGDILIECGESSGAGGFGDLILQDLGGNVGIGGVANSNVKLHVQNGSSGVTPDSSTVLAVESGFSASISILTPDNATSSLLFGNPTSEHGGEIAYNVTGAQGTPHGFQFHVHNGGGEIAMVITQDSKIGVGTLTPGAMLHVWDSTDVHSTGGGAFRVGASTTDFLAMDNNEIQVFVGGLPADLFLQVEGGGVHIHNAVDGVFDVNIDHLVVAANGDVSMVGSVHADSFNLNDGKRINFGTGDDMYIFHSGTEGLIINDFGELHIGTGVSQPLRFFTNGLERANIGSSGELNLMSTLHIPDSKEIYLGATGEMYIMHVGTEGIVTNTSGKLRITSTDNVHIHATGATHDIMCKLGSSTSLTSFNVEDSSNVKIFSVFGNGQVAIGADTAPDNNSLLTLQSTTRGFTLPRMTEAQYESIGGPKDGMQIYDTTNHLLRISDDVRWRSLSDPQNVINIACQADWDDLVVLGEISITSSMTLLVKAAITTDAEIVISSGVNLSILGDKIATAAITYTGAGTFITSDGVVILRIHGFNSLDGNSTGTFFDISNSGIFIELSSVGLFNWADLGTLTDCAQFRIPTAGFFFSGAGFKLNGVGKIFLKEIAGFNISSHSGPWFELNNTPATQTIAATISENSITLKSDESLLLIHSDIGEDSRIRVDGVIIGDGGDLFDTDGATGTFTTVVDETVAPTTINNVNNLGGLAEFEYTGDVISVNQKIVIAGYTTNTDYNGTFIVLSVPVGGRFTTGVAFGTDETGGNWSSDSVELTDANTTLVDGDTITIHTDGSTAYDGAYTVYKKETHSFRINHAFSATESGTWDTAGIDQTNPQVLANGNPGFIDSEYTATAFVNDNSTANGAIVSNTFTDMVFGTGGSALVPASTMERWKLIDELNGTFEYTGNEPFAGYITFDFTVGSSGGAQNFRFKWQKDTGSGFADLADNVEALVNVGTNPQSITKTYPLAVTKGDQIKPQITRNAGISGITTSYATIYATQ